MDDKSVTQEFPSVEERHIEFADSLYDVASMSYAGLSRTTLAKAAARLEASLRPDSRAELEAALREMVALCGTMRQAIPQPSKALKVGQKALAALSSPTSDQEQPTSEPVAWMYTTANPAYFAVYPDRQPSIVEKFGRTETPLYATDHSRGLEEADVERAAIALWIEDAKRAAPNVTKHRNTESFRANLLPADRERWLGQARAAIRAIEIGDGADSGENG